MGPVGHSLISAGIGAVVWGTTSSSAAGGAAFGVGVLTDVDHLFDYYQWYIRRSSSRIYLFFHAWEYPIVGLLVLVLFYYHPVLLAVVLAHLGHVAADHLHNNLTPLGYSIVYRSFVRFDTARITPNHRVLLSYKSWPRMLPFGQRIEPWYERTVEPWFRSRINE